MTKISKITYLGDLRTEATHLKSGSIIQTDAPTDNNGKGALFSPTDLMSTSLGSCMLTMMGIRAKNEGWNLQGEINIHKIMSANPRKVATIKVELKLSLDIDTENNRKILEKIALTCPVGLSLSPELNQEISFEWINSN